nr:MAG TPA: hypothetical protein [Caudoviricetes sp.]
MPNVANHNIRQQPLEVVWGLVNTNYTYVATY